MVECVHTDCIWYFEVFVGALSWNLLISRIWSLCISQKWDVIIFTVCTTCASSFMYSVWNLVYDHAYCIFLQDADVITVWQWFCALQFERARQTLTELYSRQSDTHVFKLLCNLCILDTELTDWSICDHP